MFVEDDDRLALFTAEYLTERGVVVVHVRDGEQGLALQAKQAFDVVILDVMLPGRDGFDVCRALRKRTAIPILLLTARAEEVDRVLGLELGADDYMVKPFSPRELLARVHALVRRASGNVGPRAEVLRAGQLVLNPTSLRVTLAGADVTLTASEFQLLRALVERSGHVLTREQLLELADGNSEEAFDRSIDVRISRLRQKLGDDPRRPTLIRTVRGLGYMLTAGGEAS
ncbi:Phosphate regulon transcriptional regulatory protein PhoB (SphR) [Minicystis rosea]|nr:Phosphate regulon transcriptional regulatory protein PhoB (SphR) [Minicystis rosea]